MFMSEFIEKRKLVHYPDGVSVNKIFYEHSQDILKHVEITLNLKKIVNDFELGDCDATTGFLNYI